MEDDERRQLTQLAAAADWYATDPTPELDSTPFRAVSAATIMAALEAKCGGLRPWMEQLERVAAAKAALHLAAEANVPRSIVAEFAQAFSMTELEWQRMPLPEADDIAQVLRAYAALARIAYDEGPRR